MCATEVVARPEAGCHLEPVERKAAYLIFEEAEGC